MSATATRPGKKDRATHFLCFPISSEITVPTLAASIARYKDIATDSTTSSIPRRRLETGPDGTTRVVTGDERQLPQIGSLSAAISHDEHPESITRSNNPLKRLQVLPAITHRAPGTYHLTIGVMNLAEESRMQSAVKLLNSLDLRQILANAEKSPPPGTKEARRWTEGNSEVLEDDKDREAAAKAVPSTPTATRPSMTATCTESHLPEHQRPLLISLTGLGAFHSPKKARVIWARPREQLSNSKQDESRPSFTDSSRLYNFALHLNSVFRKAGLINETRPLVLHALVSNMRYAVQAKGGRTSKGGAWSHGKKRWQEGLVDVRPLCQVFNNCNGDSHAWSELQPGKPEPDDSETINEAEDDSEVLVEPDEAGTGGEYIWARDIEIDRVAICKMGATKADETWEEYYPPIAEQFLSSGVPTDSGNGSALSD